ncbi:hypothetical protein QEN19_002988 [Hanseniaspora menglaensis]
MDESNISRSETPRSSASSLLSIPIENCLVRLSIDTDEKNMQINSDLFKSSKQKFIDNIGIDIGGTLAKYTYYDLENKLVEFGFKQTDDIDGLISTLQNIIFLRSKNSPESPIKAINATGGGAYKFYTILKDSFPDIVLNRKDEMTSLIHGLNFFINLKQREIFTYSDTDGKNYVQKQDSTFKDQCGDNDEIILVNIGSGVSILKLNLKTNEFKRVGGSSLGGGTLWGLLTLITGITDYDEMLKLASHGDNTKVDMLVGDIYGTSYDAIGLKSTSIGSSMAKIYKKPGTDFNYGDISKSLLYTVSNNIGQISYLQANIHNIDRIFFAGSYIRGHLMTMNTLSYAINFWSKNEKSAFFLEHESYLGAMGALVS